MSKHERRRIRSTARFDLDVNASTPRSSIERSETSTAMPGFIVAIVPAETTDCSDQVPEVASLERGGFRKMKGTQS